MEKSKYDGIKYSYKNLTLSIYNKFSVIENYCFLKNTDELPTDLTKYNFTDMYYEYAFDYWSLFPYYTFFDEKRDFISGIDLLRFGNFKYSLTKILL